MNELKYGSAADVAKRIREWLGPNGRENTASLLLYEAMKALESQAAPSAAPAELTDADIERGWHQTFSTSNPFCPCDLKSFTKAVRWAESALRSRKEPA